jgi:thiamine kinase-like enzyme
MGSYSRDAWKNTKQRYVLYYYIMEKLQKITEDEHKVFDSLVSHEDRGKKKNFTPAKVKEMLQGLRKGLDFDAQRVTFFYDNFNKSPVAHLDIHPRNIMKDAAGNFKLIDFDRAEINNGKRNED